MRQMFLMTLVAVLAGAARPAHAEPTCAVSVGQGANYIDAVTHAMDGKSCGEASQIAEGCMMAASGDVAIAGRATEICRKDFARNKADKALFTKLTQRCEKKFRGMDGTMYISARAFCALDVARLLSSLNLGPDE
ncbi:MAG: hypothetical protein K8W52_15335 [Deltaproteobacteria bacterium]|nr:hypothetical protein [Deltaproteobacteria bacterium]